MSKTNLLKIVLMASLVGIAIFFALRQRPARALRVGDSAPDFTLPALTSGSVTLADYRQRVVVLNFWATWCPPCVMEMPSLERFAQQMRDRGAVVIGVSVDRDSAVLTKFVAEQRLSFPIARDPAQALASSYGTFKFPETYVIDRQGRLAQKIIGAIDWQDPRIVDFIQQLAVGSGRAAR